MRMVTALRFRLICASGKGVKRQSKSVLPARAPHRLSGVVLGSATTARMSYCPLF